MTRGIRSSIFSNTKRREKKRLVVQGVAYLKTLLDQKAEFTYLLEELKGISLKPKAIDWGATRMIFIVPSYNNYQLEITKLNNAPFSLYNFSKYGKDLFSLVKIEYKSKDKTDFIDLKLGLESKEVKKEIKVLINLNIGQIEDLFKIAKVMKYDDGSKIGHDGNGDYQVTMGNENNIDKIMFLIKQSHKING